MPHDVVILVLLSLLAVSLVGLVYVVDNGWLFGERRRPRSWRRMQLPSQRGGNRRTKTDRIV